MIRFGILTVQKQRMSLLKKMRHPVLFYERFVTQAEIEVAVLSWTEEELRTLPQWYKNHLYRKGVRFLKKRGCKKVSADLSCYEALFQCQLQESFVTAVPRNMIAGGGMFLIGEHIKNDLSAMICIERVQDIPKELLEALCPKMNALTIVTADSSNAIVFSEFLCERYGFYPKIVNEFSCLPTDWLFLDIENGILCLNDCLIDGVEFRMDLHQYRVSQEIFLSGADIPFEKLEFVSWTKGKKRLTSR